MKAKIDEICKQAEKFLMEILEEEYLAGAGISETIDTDSIFAKYSQLAEVESFFALREYASSVTDGEEKRRLGYLLEFCGQFLEGFASRKLKDKIDNTEANQTLEFDRKTHSFRMSQVLLRNIAERGKRRELEDLILGIVAKNNRLYLDYWRFGHRIAGELGYGSYVGYCKDLGRLDLAQLEQVTTDFLKGTEELFRDNLKYQVDKVMGIPLKELERHDSLFLFRATAYDHLFQKERMLPAVERWAGDMGIDMRAEGNIHFDLEQRDRKRPRAFCCPIEIPNRVVLTIMPQGGVEDYKSFLHELGHSLHFGYSDGSLPMEYRYLGDNSVTESFAFLIEHLSQNPLWLSRYLGEEDYSEYIRFACTNLLYMVRRYSAKLSYELQLHDGSPVGEERGDLYARLLSKACLCKYPPKSYLVDVDADFYAARYLRAWLFWAQLENYLREKYDLDWFSNPKAGEFLMEGLWSRGQKESAEEMAVELGYDGLDVESLMEMFKGNLT